MSIRNAEREATELRLRAENLLLQARALASEAKVLEQEAELVVIRSRYAAAVDSLVDKSMAQRATAAPGCAA